jgi:hypothetical protein
MNEFIQTPLFQLNLLLWTVWSDAPAWVTGIRPFFREEDFRLHSIGQPLALTLQNQLRAQQANIEIQNGSSPDLIFIHSNNHLLLPIECKTKSFSPYSSTARQANCLLCNNGNDIAQNIGFSTPHLWNAHLHYAVQHGHQTQMLHTLNELSDKLKKANIDPVATGTIGIHVEMDEGIYLNFLTNGDANETLFQPENETIKIKELAKDENPHPLYLMPIEISSHKFDSTGLKVLEEKFEALLYLW